MPVLYVARSNAVSKWAAEVGLTKLVYKVGLSEARAADAVKALNAAKAAGESDWKLVDSRDVDAGTEAEALARVRAKEMPVDPNYYPKLKGTAGLFKVKLANVENRILMTQAYANEQLKAVAPNHADIASYLLALAAG